MTSGSKGLFERKRPGYRAIEANARIGLEP